MANYRGILLTQKGRALLAKAQTGITLRFTKVKIGDGDVQPGESLDTLNDLISPKLNLAITHMQADNSGTCHIRTNITNTGLEQGFFVKEVGLFAMNEVGEEILYAITTATNPDYIPPDGSATVVNNQFDINILVGNAENVQADVNPNGLVNQDDFDDHLNKSDTEAHPEAVRTLNQSVTPVNQGTLPQILDGFAHQFQALIGSEDWTDVPTNSIEQMNRMLRRIALQLEIDGRAPGSNGSFLDTLDGNPSRMTFLDATADLTEAVSAGATTLLIDMVKGEFLVGTQVIIEDDVNRQELMISAVEDGKLTVSAVANDYKKGARISRSSVVIDTVKQEMRIGDWGTHSVKIEEVV